MGKRKATAEDKTPTTDKMAIDGEEDSGSDEDFDILNIDFEWFDPDPTIDYHGLKTLLRQLFDADNQLLDLSALTDLILSQPSLGSVVKTDGKESDPFAFLSILDLNTHRQEKCISQLVEWIQGRATSPQLQQESQKALSPNSHTGLILTERVINMPHQVIPPLYNFLLDAIKSQKLHFTHYLILSRTYTEVASKLDAETNPPSKKSKANGNAPEVFYFHPEDEVLQQHALAHQNFQYEKQGDEGASDSRRTFSEMGIKPQGTLILIEGPRFTGAVKHLTEYLSGD